MKYKGAMLIVKDMEKTKQFYTKVLSLRVISDLGVNVTFTGGLSAQTEESWIAFTSSTKEFFRYQGNDSEFYFEEEEFAAFLQHAENLKVSFLEGVLEMPWGQRVVRFYDPDHHIIEVGEDMKSMLKRLKAAGLSIEELVAKTYLKKGMIERLLNS